MDANELRKTASGPHVSQALQGKLPAAHFGARVDGRRVADHARLWTGLEVREPGSAVLFMT